MNKSLMISIQPKHLVNILNGTKTLELRKSIPKEYEGWVNLYCTINGDNLVYNDKSYQLEKGKRLNYDLNGKVVARFWFDEYIAYKYYEDDNSYFAKRPQDFGYGAEEVLERLCLSRDEFKAYGKGKDLYAWHIKKLEIFDEPKSLSDFYKATLYYSWRLQKAPQSWQFVYTKELENESNRKRKTV